MARNRFHASLALLCLLFPMRPAWAQEAAPAPASAAELEALRAEVQQLKEQIAALQAQIAALRAEFDAAEDEAAFIAAQDKARETTLAAERAAAAIRRGADAGSSHKTSAKKGKS